jgi:hypothetical protein
VLICQPRQTFLSMGSFCTSLVKLYNCCLWILCNNLKVSISVQPLWDRKLDQIKPSLRAIFNKSLCCLIGQKGDIGTDFWSVRCVILPPPWHKKSDFPGDATPALGNKPVKLAESSETTVQRNSLKEHNPQAVSIPQLLRGTKVFSHSGQFKRNTQMRGLLQIQMKSIMPRL